ncbi:hypothetical protein B0O80DRAFT_455066 [Mortierella sp. GBAus27b]|nr:hypothetical protein B0O80DRAFT_455066 [Mortierella sp. GBAus27b]
MSNASMHRASFGHSAQAFHTHIIRCDTWVPDQKSGIQRMTERQRAAHRPACSPFFPRAPPTLHPCPGTRARTTLFGWMSRLAPASYE